MEKGWQVGLHSLFIPPYVVVFGKQLELDGIHSIYLWATGLWCG